MIYQKKNLTFKLNQEKSFKRMNGQGITQVCIKIQLTGVDQNYSNMVEGNGIVNHMRKRTMRECKMVESEKREQTSSPLLLPTEI